jgi:hypothetical protein
VPGRNVSEHLGEVHGGRWEMGPDAEAVKAGRRSPNHELEDTSDKDGVGVCRGGCPHRAGGG